MKIPVLRPGKDEIGRPQVQEEVNVQNQFSVWDIGLGCISCHRQYLGRPGFWTGEKKPGSS
jgi:hypothetical protein